MSVIIDRRLNDRNKNAANRARFMRRYKAQIKRSVADMVSERSIQDMQKGGKVKLPARDVSEPHLRHGNGGDREMVLPGNRTFNPGDRLKRPPGGGGDGDGSGDGEGGSGEDNFTFALSREEFMNLFFDDLELPHLVRTQVGDIKELKPQRAGYTSQGSPTNLSVVRTMRQALGRRIALRSGARRRLDEIEALQTDDPDNEAQQVDESEIELLKKRIERVPFLDDIDLRFRNRIMVPKPMSQAVMFCLMDVSASMNEQRKDLAKRFYTLLHLFLTRKYERVEIVFIRHTNDADEVDEQTFFNDRKTGGTVVYSALELMREVIAARYPADQWNVYAAQASDGDAFGADPERSRGFLEDHLLPLVRYYAYIEVSEQTSSRISTLASTYQRIESPHFAMASVSEHRDIYPVFRTLFSSDTAGNTP
ncbi:YeaH/YhbH family protein [Granulosicoccus sp. 3-233]|uniref:YeaH/YhbH family protein n=1 Tax=Granulosicoccus sp. 3-233 TaxID=3417969 RepID=UPI003D355918